MSKGLERPLEAMSRLPVEFTDEQKEQIRQHMRDNRWFYLKRDLRMACYEFWTGGKVRYWVYKCAIRLIRFVEAQ